MKKDDNGRIQISRQDLYDLIWKTPMVRLAADFNLSNVGLAKTCKKHHIPRPPNGHWALIRNGKESPQAPLPILADKDLQVVRFRAHKDASGQGGALPEGFVCVAERLIGSHPAIALMSSFLKKAKPYGRSLLDPSSERWFKGTVAAKTTNRALRIMEAIALNLEVHGGKLTATEEHGRICTMAHMGDDELQLRLYEELTPKEEMPSEMKTTPPSQDDRRARYEATGKLVLILDSHIIDGARRRWADGKHQSVEKYLTKIVSLLIRMLEAKRVRRIEWEEYRIKRDEEARLLAEQRRRIYEEEQAVSKLLSQVEAWHQSNRIRAFVSEVVERAERVNGPLRDGDDCKGWVLWATSQADRLDPLIEDALTAQ